MARRRRGNNQDLNVWPAFVDVLATLLLVIILLVLTVTLTQFYTANRASDAELIGDKLSKRIIEQREEIDALERAKQQLLAQLDIQVKELNILTRDHNSAQKEAEDLLLKLAQIEGGAIELGNSLNQVLGQLDGKLDRVITILAEVEAARRILDVENADLRAENLGLATNLADLGERINDSLLLQAEELQRQRSLFFGALVEVLGNREDVSVVGDRFVFQSEVLFASGSAVLGTGGREQLKRLAQTILQVSLDFPADLDWILRIDGHTDNRPIGEDSLSRFENNWQLSSERARSVVQFLISEGIPPSRLAAAGFGEHQPLVAEDNLAAFAKNRRIEIKLTTR